MEIEKGPVTTISFQPRSIPIYFLFSNSIKKKLHFPAGGKGAYQGIAYC